MDVVDPVFFINDAVCLEKYVRSETFFFAHDAAMRVWLDGSVRATAVLPANGRFLSRVKSDVLEWAAGVLSQNVSAQWRSSPHEPRSNR